MLHPAADDQRRRRPAWAADLVCKDQERSGVHAAALSLGQDGNFARRWPINTNDLMMLGLPRGAAAVALNSPFRWLIPALRYQLGDEAQPELPYEWRQPQFLAWLAAVYTDHDRDWKNPHYSVLPLPEQSILHALSELGGAARTGELAEIFPGLTRGRVVSQIGQHPVVAPDGSRLHLVVRQPDRSVANTGRRIALVPCAGCRKPVTAAVNVPEVPRGLLCRCGAMPDMDKFGMDLAVRFPSDYLNLAPTLEQCREFVARDRGRAAQLRLGPNEMEILTLEELIEPGRLTTQQIQDLLGRVRGNGAERKAISVLVNKGLLERHDHPEDGRRYLYSRRADVLDDLDYRVVDTRPGPRCS